MMWSLLFCTKLYSTSPHDNTPRQIVSQCAHSPHSALHYTTLHCTTLHCTTLHCTALHYTALHCTALHYTALHYTTLHYNTLHIKPLHFILSHHIKLCHTTLHLTNYSPLLFPLYLFTSTRKSARLTLQVDSVWCVVVRCFLLS